MMENESDSGASTGAQPKGKNLGCLLLIVVVVIAVVMSIMSSNKKTHKQWDEEKADLLPQLQELAKNGDYEELLEKSDRFQIIKDEELVRLRSEAKEIVEKREAEKKAKEEEESQKNTPGALVEKEIHERLGDGKWKQLESVEIVGESEKAKTAVIRFEVKEKKSSTGSQMMDDIGKLVSAAMKVDGVDRVTIHPMVEVVDDLGNKNLAKAATLTLDRETAEKVNWKNLGGFEKFAVFEKYGTADLTQLFPEID